MISIIVPFLNEADALTRLGPNLRTLRGPAEILFVDGLSTDDSPRIARRFGAVLSSPPGRARQMNLAASTAAGDLLLFLHAHSLQPASPLPDIPRDPLRPHRLRRKPPCPAHRDLLRRPGHLLPPRNLPPARRLSRHPHLRRPRFLAHPSTGRAHHRPQHPCLRLPATLAHPWHPSNHPGGLAGPPRSDPRRSPPRFGPDVSTNRCPLTVFSGRNPKILPIIRS